MKDPIERQDAPDTNVGDMISRQAAIESIERMKPYQQDADDICEMLQNMPSAQPEIVRCKDCRWRKDQSGSSSWLPCRAIITPSDFYCGRAERRTDETD